MKSPNHPKLVEKAVNACVPTTQTELARRLDVSIQTVNAWTKGKRPVPMSQAIAIERETYQKVKAVEFFPILENVKIAGATNGEG